MASGGTTTTVGNGGTVMRALYSAANLGFGVPSTTFCGTIWGYACGTLFLYTVLLSPIQVSCVNQSQTDSVVCKLLSLKLRIATL